jgi:hypothetical protein
MIDTAKENSFLIDIVIVIVVALIVALFAILLFKYYYPSRSTSVTDYGKLYGDINYTQIQNEVDLLSIPQATNESAEAVVVLAYHRITADSNDSKDNPYDMSFDRFKSQMYSLKEKGYQTITIDELYSFMRGERQVPDKSIIITFDDGIRSSYYFSDPILKALNYSAVMFVISGYSMSHDPKSYFYNSRYYLNGKEITSMQQSGRWDIEAHAYIGHNRELINPDGEIAPFYANKLWIKNESRLETDAEYEKRISYDISRVKSDIETDLNKSVVGFAVPFGDFGQRNTDYPEANQIILKHLEPLYKMVFYQFKPTSSSTYRANYNDKKNDFYFVMRLAVESGSSSEELVKRINAAEPIDLPYLEDFSNKMRWVTDTGMIDMSEKITLTEMNDSTKPNLAQTYLDGSYLWTNYDFSTRILDNQAENIYLLVRLQDASNYVACKFTNSSINFLKIVNGEAVAVEYQKADNPVLTGNILSASVKGNDVICSSNNQVLTVNNASIHSYGGVGIRAVGFYSLDSKVSFDNILITGGSS